jgi:hypothetical protein
MLLVFPLFITLPAKYLSYAGIAKKNRISGRKPGDADNICAMYLMSIHN